MPAYLDVGTTVAFSPDGKTLASLNGYPARIVLLDVAQLLDQKLQRAAGRVEYVGGYVDSESDPVKVRLSIRGRISREALAGLKELSRPIELALDGGGNLSDDVLSALGNIPRLEQLNLNGTKITDAGIEYLKGLNLKRLQIGNTAITEQGIERLRKAMPNTDVSRL